MYRQLNSVRVAHKLKEIVKPKEGVEYITNRNPRNLERLRIAYKPIGYHLEKPGRSFWHKLELEPSRKHISAHVRHFENGPVITASTSEWAIKQFLFKTTDTCAYVNLARVLAQRCLEAGLIEIQCDIKPTPNGKVDKFLRTLESNGISLTEPDRYKIPQPWDVERPEKPWEVTE